MVTLTKEKVADNIIRYAHLYLHERTSLRISQECRVLQNRRSYLCQCLDEQGIMHLLKVAPTKNRGMMKESVVLKQLSFEEFTPHITVPDHEFKVGGSARYRWFVQEYFNGNNLYTLRSFYMAKRELTNTNQYLLDFFDLFTDLSYNCLVLYHKYNIVHRDINLTNILLVGKKDGQKSSRMIDFELAHPALYKPEVIDYSRPQSVRCSFSHTPPEVIRGGVRYDKVDVYGIASLMGLYLSDEADVIFKKYVNIQNLNVSLQKQLYQEKFVFNSLKSIIEKEEKEILYPMKQELNEIHVKGTWPTCDKRFDINELYAQLQSIFLTYLFHHSYYDRINYQLKKIDVSASYVDDRKLYSVIVAMYERYYQDNYDEKGISQLKKTLIYSNKLFDKVIHFASNRLRKDIIYTLDEEMKCQGKQMQNYIKKQRLKIEKYH